MSGEIKMNRIKSANRAALGLLGEVTKEALVRVPKLRQTVANRIETREMTDTLSALGAYVRANGFDPTRTFQHVANFDIEIWTLILDMFAKHDPETGELTADGLLYKYDEAAGAVKLNKDFFYAILNYLESLGIPCDMRGKIKLN